jgi:hypothetical protein
MRFSFTFVTPVVLLAFAGDGLLAQDYLTKDGHLARQLKLVQLRGGFAGNTGVRYTIEPDGSWAAETLFNEKATPKDKGKLTAKDLAKLGALLERYDLGKLPEQAGKKPGANPHTLTLEFGAKKASLVGQVPPRLDPNDPAGTVESRFAGIWEGVVGLLTPAAKEK